MTAKVYRGFMDEFKKMITETPDLDRFINYYERGLLTHTEALRHIVDAYIEYTVEQTMEEWRSEREKENEL